MSVLRPFQLAREALGVAPDADAAAIKRAYRRLAVEHPPDTDPEGFRRVRDAYELLTDPGPRAREMLLSPRPAVGPPPLPAPPAKTPPGELALELLRAAVWSVPASALLAPGSDAAPSPVTPSSEGKPST